jgi:hypothetical protein
VGLPLVAGDLLLMDAEPLAELSLAPAPLVAQPLDPLSDGQSWLPLFEPLEGG